MKKSKVPSGRWIVRCDGLKVGICPNKKEAEDMADALQQHTPNGMSMKFSIEPEPVPAK